VNAGLRSPFLSRLELDGVSINFAIFESCVALKVLELRYVSFRGTEDEVAPHANRRCDLDSLTISAETSSFVYFVNWLLSPGSTLGITHLRYLTVAAHGDEPVTVTARLVEANACTLEEFIFSSVVRVPLPIIFPDPIDFSRCTHLRRVSFTVFNNKFSSYSLRWSSQTIQEIEFTAIYTRSIDNSDMTGWNTIDSVLTRSAFPCLRRVIITRTVYSTSDHSEWFVILRRALPALDSSGILFLETRFIS